MRDTRLTETCACGATFGYLGEWSSDAHSAADKWRKGHRHEFPPVLKPARVHLPLARRRA